MTHVLRFFIADRSNGCFTWVQRVSNKLHAIQLRAKENADAFLNERRFAPPSTGIGSAAADSM
jgi:hypothetical protein